MEEQEKNPPCEPATDEQIESWRVQVDYGASVVISNIARSSLGAILSRLERAEHDRTALRAEVERLKARIALGGSGVVT